MRITQVAAELIIGMSKRQVGRLVKEMRRSFLSSQCRS